MFEFNEVTEENKIKKHFSCQRHLHKNNKRSIHIFKTITNFYNLKF